MLTAFVGEGQQCNAAPAWTASTEPDENGSLETSALTRARLLHSLNISMMNLLFLVQKLRKRKQEHFRLRHITYLFKRAPSLLMKSKH